MGGLQKLFSVLINPLRRVSLSRSTRLYMLPLSTLRKRMFLPNPGFSSKITRNIHTQLSYTEDYGSTHGVSIDSSTVNSSNILNQWQMLLNNLRTEGYFDRRDLDIQTNFQYDLLEHMPEDFARSVNACLLFAQERPHLLRLLPKNDVNNVVENGSLSLFKHNCDSLKRLKLFSASDDVHHIPESERAQTMDIMRLILTYMHNYLFSSQILESATSHNMGVSVHNLLNAMIHTSRPSQGLNFNEPIAGHVPNGWGQAPRTFRKNIEMKRGDWICPRCNFMNFARNMKCLECNEERPKAQLTDGDWMCPQCDFFNYGRNQSCVKCDCKKPYESSSGFGGSHDYKKSDESSVSGYSQKPQGEHASTGNSSIKTEIEKMLAANDEKAERWFSKISQMENVNDLSSAVDDEDFPEIMPMRKGVNRFVVSTRKTPLERRMANAQYRRNLGNGGSIEVNESQLQASGGKNSHINEINIDKCKGTDDNERNNNDNVNFVSFAPFPPNYFGKKNNALESNQMPESGISSSSLPEKSVNILTKVQSQQQDKGGLDSGLHGRELDKFTGISDLRENICERQNGGHNPSQFWPNDSTKDAGRNFSSSSPGVSNPLSSYESSDGKRWNAGSRITSSQMQVSGELHDENSCNWNMSGTSSLQPNGALNDKKGWNSYSASGISNIHASNAPNDEENWNWNNKPGISRTQPSNAPNDGMSWNRNNGYEVSHPQSNMVPSNSGSWKSEPSASSQRAENSFSTNERERWNSRIQNPSQFSPNNSGHTMGCWNNGSGISSPQPSNGPNDGVGWNWNNRSEISHPQSNMTPNNGDSWKSGPSPSSQILENSFFNNDSGRCTPGIQNPSQFPPNTNVHTMESWNNGPGISNPNASNGQSDGNSWNWSKGSDIQYPQSNTGQRGMQNWKSESATNSWTDNNDKERWSNGSGIQYPKSNTGQNEVQNWNSESTTNSWANIANRKEWGNGSHIQNNRTWDTNQSKHSGSQMKGTENDTGSWNNGFMGKSLEGSAVKKEPDPLDMSEEAKAERWFRRVAQIKDISELSQIPDEDFPQIMPMRKGVNRFVVSKRKTPLERRLTSPQYRRNLPIVSSTPGKDEN